jgi:hypothetical protein
MMRRYIFCLNSLTIHRKRSKDAADLDYLSVAGSAGGRPFSKSVFMGGGSSGVLTGPWSSDFVEVASGDTVAVNYTVTNLSHTDADARDGKAGQLALGIQAIVLGAVSAGTAGVAAVVAAIAAGVVGLLANFFPDLIGQAPDCDGPVLSQDFVFGPGQIDAQVDQVVPIIGQTQRIQSNCGAEPLTDAELVILSPPAFSVATYLRDHRDINEFLHSARRNVSLRSLIPPLPPPPFQEPPPDDGPGPQQRLPTA